MGAPDGREDPPDPGACDVAALPARVPGRLGRRADRRADPRCSPAAGTPGESSSTRCGCPGVVPQVCVLFGPSAAGGAYIPAFCDVVIMRDGNASMYLGSPRMAEMVIGERVTLEEMGGARMHTAQSGCGHALVGSDEEGIEFARRYLGYMPRTSSRRPRWRRRVGPRPKPKRCWAKLIPADENKPFDMRGVLDGLLDEASFLEIHARWAKELIVGYGRLDGRAIGVVASQPKVKGGVLFVDSSDKAARFISDVQRLQRAAAVSGGRSGVHDRNAGRAPGNHPPRGEDDQRGLRGDRPEAVGDRPQGLRRRPVRDGRTGVRPRLLPGAARAPRSP